MHLPNFIAIEANSYTETSFPISLAWSLDCGSIKHALILPDEAWLEGDDEEIFNSEYNLSLEAFSAHEVLKEFLYDQTQDTFYIASLWPEEVWLDKFFTAANEEQNFNLEVASSLVANPETWHDCYNEKLTSLGLDASKAEDQVSALLATYAQLVLHTE